MYLHQEGGEATLVDLIRTLPIAAQYNLEGIALKALQAAGVDGAERPYVLAIANENLNSLPAIQAGREAVRAAFDQHAQGVS